MFVVYPCQPRVRTCREGKLHCMCVRSSAFLCVVVCGPQAIKRLHVCPWHCGARAHHRTTTRFVPGSPGCGNLTACVATAHAAKGGIIQLPAGK